MDTNTNNWSVGELVRLERQERDVKTSGSTAYRHYVASRYICIREETKDKSGILVKVLGKAFADQLLMVDGRPFCKDDVDERFTDNLYFSYPFPLTKDVREVVGILREDSTLVERLEEEKMHINPNSTFWVADTLRNRLFMKRPQVYSAREDQLHPASVDVAHYRLSIVYFAKGQLSW